MKTKKIILTGIAALCTAGLVSAKTTLLLEKAFNNGYVLPSSVTVPAGENLWIAAVGVEADSQWFMNGEPIEGQSDPSLLIPAATLGHAGTYQYKPTGISIPESGSQLLRLNVGPVPRFMNVSARGSTGGGEEPLITGFVVTGPLEKRVLIRAVGPSLDAFGVSDSLADPVIHIYDATGALYTREYTYDSGQSRDEAIVEASLKAGAAPLVPGADDAVELRPFPQGAYTVHVTSADGERGVVVVEIFEVP